MKAKENGIPFIEEEGGGVGGIISLLFPEIKEKGARRGREILLYAATFGLAALFARTHLAYGMYPFALAYLAVKRRRVVPAFLGGILGALRMGGVGGIFATATAFLLLLRVIFSLPVKKRAILPLTDTLFSEGLGLRILSAALTGAALAGYELAVSGTRDFALYFAAASVLAPTLLATLFSWAEEQDAATLSLSGELSARTPRGWALLYLSLLSLILSLAFALLPLFLFGLSLAALFTSSVTLFAARRYGAARAGALGLLAGLLFGPVRAAAFALLGLVSGILFPLGTVAGLLFGLSGAIAFSVYTDGLSGFLEVAPEATVAALLLLPILKTAGGEGTAAEGDVRTRLLAATRGAARKRQEGGAQLSRLSAALLELSTLFHRLSSEERRPSVTEYFSECQRVCARYCSTCSSRIRCWEQADRVAEGAILSLSKRLRDTGRIAEEDLPEALGQGCPRIGTILDEIREECAAMALRRHKGDRNEALSLDYAMLSRLLSDAEAADRSEEGEDREATERLCAALGRRSPLACSVTAGRRCRVAVGAAVGTQLLGREEEIHGLAEGAVALPLSRPTAETLDGALVLTMQGVERFAVSAASSSLPLVGSGDRLRHFTSPDGYFYAVLSDGMGKGEEAAAVAEVSVEFLRVLLSAGCSRRVAVRMLNSLVRARQSECSATVDMLIFDLFSGHAAFLKSGAAPSYIKRGGEILRVKSRTIPLGLTRTPDAELLNVEVEEGDLIVLLSDGILPNEEEPAWLFPLLSSQGEGDLSFLANRIVAEATARISEPRDDITVGLFRIGRAAREDEEER